MTPTVLVTGAGGFVGSHVVEAVLTRTDWRVIAVDSLRHNGSVDNLIQGASLDVARVTSWVHDLTVAPSPSQRRRLGHVDLVVNAASRCHVGESIDEPVEFVTNNVQLMLTTLELARELRPRRLVHVSTDEVYGPTSPTTSTDHRPSSPYAASKAAQEDLCHAYARTYGVPITVVSSANMFGERQGGRAFLPVIFRHVARGQPIPIHYHDGKPGTRNYSYVRNVAECVVDELLTHVDVAWTVDGPPRVRRLPLTGQREVDNLTLARRVAELAGLPFDFNVVDVASVRPGYDPSYAELRSSWRPRVDFDEALERTVRWYVEHRDAWDD